MENSHHLIIIRVAIIHKLTEHHENGMHSDMRFTGESRNHMLRENNYLTLGSSKIE